MSGTLDEIRGRHIGRSCVVLGAGPSLERVDERVYKHVTIAVNSAIAKMPESDYFCSSDYGVLEYNYWNDVESCWSHLLLRDCSVFRGLVEHGSIPRTRIVLWPRGRQRAKMSVDDKDIMIGILSSHCAVNLAVVMGCNPIYLIGNDCAYKHGKKYWWECANDDVGRHRSGAASYTIAAMRHLGRRMRDNEYELGATSRSDGVLSAGIKHWEKIVLENPTVKIVDCSGGRLRGKVPQMTAEDMLNRRPYADA